MEKQKLSEGYVKNISQQKKQRKIRQLHRELQKNVRSTKQPNEANSKNAGKVPVSTRKKQQKVKAISTKKK